MKIEIIKAGPVFIATAYDDTGKEIGCITGFSRKSAKRLIQEKVGVCATKLTKKLKNEAARHKKEKLIMKNNNLIKSGSVMTGLIGVTSSRNWKHVK